MAQRKKATRRKSTTPAESAPSSSVNTTPAVQQPAQEATAAAATTTAPASAPAETPTTDAKSEDKKTRRFKHSTEDEVRRLRRRIRTQAEQLRELKKSGSGIRLMKKPTIIREPLPSAPASSTNGAKPSLVMRVFDAVIEHMRDEVARDLNLPTGKKAA